MIKQLFENERIQTTRATAEFIRQPAEQLITLAKRVQDADQAQETASRVVSLFQEQPELAATAQGGRVTSEKVDAYLSQNFG